MTIFIKAKLKKSDDQTNIDKYRVSTNITEYVCENVKNQHMYELFGHHYRVPTLSKFYPTVSGFIIPCL